MLNFSRWLFSRTRADSFRETIKKPERDFRIEWRDQSILRLEELLEISTQQTKWLKEQLDETVRRKSIRDEECNKLRGEVDEWGRRARDYEWLIEGKHRRIDELKAEVECLKSTVEAMTYWIAEKNRTIVRQAGEIANYARFID